MTHAWELTWFYDEKDVRERYARRPDFVADDRRCREYPTGMVYHQRFLLPTGTNIETVIDALVFQERERIAAARENTNIAEAKRQRYTAENAAHAHVVNHLANRTKKSLAEYIANRQKWLTHWEYFRPSQPHWTFDGRPLCKTEHHRRFTIEAEWSWLTVDHHVVARLPNGLNVKVNVNAYEGFVKHIHEMAAEIESVPLPYRGIQTNPRELFILPAEAVKVVAAHDWEQYADQMKAWDEEDKKKMEALAAHPNVGISR